MLPDGFDMNLAWRRQQNAGGNGQNARAPQHTGGVRYPVLCGDVRHNFGGRLTNGLSRRVKRQGKSVERVMPTRRLVSTSTALAPNVKQ
jgi:hypothetical protein